jgi:ABC-type lipopolysaccharide export system ATPase subunit
MQTKQAQVERHQVVNTHLDLAVMEGVEVLLADGILAEVDPPLLVLRIQLLALLFLLHKTLIDSLARKGLAILIVNHKVKQRHLIGYRISEIEFDPVLLVSVDNF